MFPDSGMFILGHNTATKALISLHPTPVQIFRLWQTFLVNVNPLVKIFHAPTVQQIVLDASGDLTQVPKATEALMFAIYLLAVTSLKAEECESMFGESRTSLLSKYSHGAQQALINAKFLRSLNLYSLQAFSLFLLALRRGYDPHTFCKLIERNNCILHTELPSRSLRAKIVSKRALGYLSQPEGFELSFDSIQGLKFCQYFSLR
jgi:hypothetical protein